MDPFSNPIIMMTRPIDGSRRFLAALNDIKTAYRPVISPAFDLEKVPTDDVSFDSAIFTSAAGVSHAPLGAGRTAWCVGDSTARSAQRAGYDARSAKGDAQALIALILRERPQEKLMHFRGEVSKGNVVGVLREAGLSCEERIIYRKAKRRCAEDVAKRLNGEDIVILPLFSAETVSIIKSWDLVFSTCHVVAISPDVAEAAVVLGARSVTVSARPDQDTMAQTVAGMIA